jgi:hypothetical protein
MACIVLLVDWSINKSPQDKDVTDAFRLLEEAKTESECVAKMVNSIMQVLRKRRIPESRDVICNNSIRSIAGQHLPGTTTTPGAAIACPIDNEPLDINRQPEIMITSSLLGTHENGENLSFYFNEMAHDFEQGLDIQAFDWSNIFSDLSSSFL